MMFAQFSLFWQSSTSWKWYVMSSGTLHKHRQHQGFFQTHSLFTSDWPPLGNSSCDQLPLTTLNLDQFILHSWPSLIPHTKFHQTHPSYCPYCTCLLHSDVVWESWRMTCLSLRSPCEICHNKAFVLWHWLSLLGDRFLSYLLMENCTSDDGATQLLFDKASFSQMARWMVCVLPEWCQFLFQEFRDGKEV